MKGRIRRTIEAVKGSIAFVVFIISLASMDSEKYYIPMATTLISILYLLVLSNRAGKRGEF